MWEPVGEGDKLPPPPPPRESGGGGEAVKKSEKDDEGEEEVDKVPPPKFAGEGLETCVPPELAEKDSEELLVKVGLSVEAELRVNETVVQGEGDEVWEAVKEEDEENTGDPLCEEVGVRESEKCGVKDPP